MPEKRNYQEKVLEIKAEDEKALVPLDKAPAHPSDDVLTIADGRIKRMIQPMGHGVISAFKRRYQRKYLEELLFVLENEDNSTYDTRGTRTLANIKGYSI